MVLVSSSSGESELNELLVGCIFGHCELQGHWKCCQRDGRCLYHCFYLLMYLFIGQIDWEESTNNNRICVRPHIDEELDQRKHVYAGLDAVLVGLFLSQRCFVILLIRFIV